MLDKESVNRAAEEVAKAFGDGGVDVLVNNAGFSAGMKPFAGPDVDVWWHTWEVNVRSVVCSKNDVAMELTKIVVL